MSSAIALLPLYVIAQAGSPDPGAADAAPPVESGISLLTYIHAGGVLSYVLIALSIVAVALVIRNLLALRIAQLAPPDAVRELERLLREQDLAGAQRFAAQHAESTFLTNIFSQALERCATSPLGALELRTAVEDAAHSEVDELHRFNDGLGIIAAVGPMLGLLGTVIGMIGAFHTIGSLEGAARSSELAKFMSMALVNTAEGLIVAIPCTVAFALFRRRINRLAGEAGRTIERLVNLVAARSGPAAAPQQRPRAATSAVPVRPVVEGSR